VTAATRSRALGRMGAVLVSGVATGAAVGLAVARVRGDRMAPWILGRATGICAYLVLVGVVLLGLSLSHPRRAERGRSAPTRMRAHVTLSLLALALIALHVVVLATDRYAGVGWSGAVLPMGAQYRPTAVTLGVVGAWIGLLAGLSAAAAGRLPRRLWWPLHKVAAISLVLIWLHGVFAGSDTPALLALYLASGAIVLVAAAHRYLARGRVPLGATEGSR
jgi:predicted ferric reductase